MDPNDQNQTNTNNQPTVSDDQPVATGAGDQTSPMQTTQTTEPTGMTGEPMQQPSEPAQTSTGMDQGMGAMPSSTTPEPVTSAMGDQTAPTTGDTSGGDTSGQPQ